MTEIVLLENIHPLAHDIFKKSGYANITSYPGTLSSEDLKLILKKADVLGIRSRTQISSEIIKNANKLQALGCFCIGTNQVDLEEAMLQGIPIFNAPFSNTRSVAELTLGEAILLLRKIPEKNYQVHQGYWEKSATGAFEIRGKTLGIIGYGNIGSQVSVLSESLGMRVIYYDIENKLPLGNAKPVCSMKELLENSDVVTLHVPGGKTTSNLINQENLLLMKQGAILINASRGDVVDVEALYRLLKNGHMGGAALDVFPCEPKNPGETLSSPLMELPNVILTPHIAGSTEESQQNIGNEVAEKLVRFLKTGATKSAVNFPEIAFSKLSGRTRILHIHLNTPGSLGSLASLLAKSRLNIVSQHLQTKGQIGYAITDVDGFVKDSIFEKLQELPTTIRCKRIQV